MRVGILSLPLRLLGLCIGILSSHLCLLSLLLTGLQQHVVTLFARPLYISLSRIGVSQLLSDRHLLDGEISVMIHIGLRRPILFQRRRLIQSRRSPLQLLWRSLCHLGVIACRSIGRLCLIKLGVLRRVVAQLTNKALAKTDAAMPLNRMVLNSHGCIS